MEPVLAFILITGLILIAGLSSSFLLGFYPSSIKEAISLIGFSYLLGVSIFLITAPIILILGLDMVFFFLPNIFLLIFAVVKYQKVKPLGFKNINWPKFTRGDQFNLDNFFNTIAWLFLIVIILIFIYGAFVAWQKPVVDWDAWSIWTRKAVALTGGFMPLKDNGNFFFNHPDYPIGFSALQGVSLKLTSIKETAHTDIFAWLLLPAFLLSLPLFIKTKLIFSLPIIGALLISPMVVSQGLSGYADVSVAIFLSLSLITAYQAIKNQTLSNLILLGIFLAASAAIKNEGLLIALMILTLLTLFNLKTFKKVLVSWGIFLGSVLPWQIWLKINNISSDLPLTKALNPNYLINSLDRSAESLIAILKTVFLIEQSLIIQTLWFLLALVLVIFFISNLKEKIALFTITVIVGAVAALVFAYTVSPYDLAWHLGTSVSRVTLTVIFLVVTSYLIILDNRLIKKVSSKKAADKIN